MKEEIHLTWYWSWYYRYLFEIEFSLKLAYVPKRRVMHINQVMLAIFVNNIYSYFNLRCRIKASSVRNYSLRSDIPLRSCLVGLRLWSDVNWSSCILAYYNVLIDYRKGFGIRAQFSLCTSFLIISWGTCVAFDYIWWHLVRVTRVFKCALYIYAVFLWIHESAYAHVKFCQKWSEQPTLKAQQMH